jgi:hypothetical protein
MPKWAKSTLGASGLLVMCLAAGCGSSTSDRKSGPSGHSRAADTPPPVAFAITSQPHETVIRKKHVVLRGTAASGATLEIDDAPVMVNESGKWRKTVKLALGDNLIGLRASMAGRTSVDEMLSLTRKRSTAELAAWRQRQRILRTQREAARVAARAQAEADFKASVVTIAYRQLMKNADAFAGKHVTYRGKIFQIQEDSSGGGMMLLAVTYDDYLDMWDDNIWVNYDGHVEGSQGDVITVTGTITGSKSYDTQAGGSTYVPEMHSRFVNE